MNQPTVREINAHVFAGTGSCYVNGPGYRFRINRARSRAGVVEGRFVIGTVPQGVEVVKGTYAVTPAWVPIPPDAEVEFFD